MMFDSWQAFIAMDGHGLYVWLAYLAALALLILNLALLRTDRRKTLRLLRRQKDEDDASQTP